MRWYLIFKKLQNYSLKGLCTMPVYKFLKYPLLLPKFGIIFWVYTNLVCLWSTAILWHWMVSQCDFSLYIQWDSISFLKWSLTGYTNNTWGQTPCPAVGDQHKKELKDTFGVFFFLVLYFFLGIKKILTCRSFAVYDGFWFYIFMGFLCVECVPLYVSCALFKKICSFAYFVLSGLF